MKVELMLPITFPYFCDSLTTVNVKPSGPRLFPFWKECITRCISSFIIYLVNYSFISSVISLGNRPVTSKISVIGHPSGSVKIFWKWSTAA